MGCLPAPPSVSLWLKGGSTWDQTVLSGYQTRRPGLFSLSNPNSKPRLAECERVCVSECVRASVCVCVKAWGERRKTAEFKRTFSVKQLIQVTAVREQQHLLQSDGLVSGSG